MNGLRMRHQQLHPKITASDPSTSAADPPTTAADQTAADPPTTAAVKISAVVVVSHR